MSNYIKYMYREYLEGRTRIKKVNEDQPLFPNTGAGLLIQKNKLTDDWTALNVSDGHYEEESFNHEALAAAFLQGANMGQLRMLRAAEAYEQGEMPISRWTKTAIIQAVKDYCFDFDLAYDPDIENNTKAELVKEFLEYKSWHHSSRTAREVEFFGLNEDSHHCTVRDEHHRPQ